jgi:hypothetical protein
MRVFLSYRRGDAAGYAGRLTDALIQRLGPKSVFFDVSAISPGRDFTVEIDRALADSNAALIVIGPGWVTAQTPDGTRRLMEPDDHVRLEVSRALTRGIRVIPVLVGGTHLPAAADLPSDLQGLPQRQAVELHDDTWHRDVDGLIRSLRGQRTVPGNRRRRWMAVGTALVVVLGLGIGSWFLWGPGAGAPTSSGSTSPPTPDCGPTGSAEWSSISLNQPPNLTKTDPTDSLTFTVKQAHWRPFDGQWQVILGMTLHNGSTAPINPGAWRIRPLQVADRQFDNYCFTGGASLEPGITEDELVGFETACKPSGAILLETDAGLINVTPDNLDPGSC